MRTNSTSGTAAPAVARIASHKTIAAARRPPSRRACSASAMPASPARATCSVKNDVNTLPMTAISRVGAKSAPTTITTTSSVTTAASTVTSRRAQVLASAAVRDRTLARAPVERIHLLLRPWQFFTHNRGGATPRSAERRRIIRASRAASRHSDFQEGICQLRRRACLVVVF